MPVKAPKACARPGCLNYTKPGSQFCEAHSPQKQPWSGGDYKTGYTQMLRTPAWENYRKSFLRRNPLCNRCGQPSQVLHHKVDHEASHDRFWDKENHEALCKKCHSVETARNARKDKSVAKMQQYKEKHNNIKEEDKEPVIV